jgi:hypothetical protein
MSIIFLSSTEKERERERQIDRKKIKLGVVVRDATFGMGVEKTLTSV